jgi:hypothetical protein
MSTQYNPKSGANCHFRFFFGILPFFPGLQGFFFKQLLQKMQPKTP